MTRAWLLALVACGSAHHEPVDVTVPKATAWIHAGDADWGIGFATPHFEVDLRRGTKVLAIADGLAARASEMTAAPTATQGAFLPAPELEQLDREFAAKSAAEGGSAWAQMFAGDGAEWSDGKRVEHADIERVMGDVLAGGTLEWQPTASQGTEKLRARTRPALRRPFPAPARATDCATGLRPMQS